MVRSPFRFVLFLFVTLFCASAFGQETTLKVGVRGVGPVDPPITQDLSTAQVDALLYAIQPGRFGPHYTRDKANAAFAKVDGMRVQLNSQLAAIGNSIADIQVRSVSTDISNIELSFAQIPTGVRVGLGNFTVHVGFRYTGHSVPILCESVDGNFTLSAISVGGDYDIPTGTLQNPRVNYWLSSISTSCNGLLGSVGDVLRGAFGYGTGYARDVILNSLRSSVDSQIQMANMRTIFSISDWLEGLRDFSNYTPLNEIANDAINTGQQIIANPSSLYRALKLTIAVRYGPAGNTVSFIASHVEDVAVSEIQYGTRGITVAVSRLGGTSQATLYRREHNSGPWYPIVTLPPGVDSYFIQGGLPIGTELVAIGQNLWHSRLRSDSGLSQTVTQNSICTRPPCEPIEP